MTAQKRKPKTLEEKMFADLPKCMVGDPYLDSITNPTAADIAYYVNCEIDLIEEGQDGTERRNLKPLLNFLKRWNLPRD